MTDRRLLHLHATDLDRLILEFVQPFFARHGESFERCSWQRHSAGGPHLRVRLTGDSGTLERVGDQLSKDAEAYFSRYPFTDLETYSADHARQLLEKEQARYEEDELEYRNNQVVERPVPPLGLGFASEDAGDFMEAFHHDVTPLAVAVLADPRPRREIVLRLYFAHALIVTGDLRTGSVSWKSHWEGFAATFPEPQLIERIGEAYTAQKDLVFRHLHEVQDLAHRNAWEEDPILEAWRDLFKTYRAEARRRLKAGQVFTVQPSTQEEAASMRAAMEGRLLRDSSFVRTFWSDDQFLTSLEYDLAFQVPRILVNLFYSLVARVGMSALDKMVLCHHVQRSVEERFDCRLQDILQQNMASCVERHGTRETDRLN